MSDENDYQSKLSVLKRILNVVVIVWIILYVLLFSIPPDGTMNVVVFVILSFSVYLYLEAEKSMIRSLENGNNSYWKGILLVSLCFLMLIPMYFMKKQNAKDRERYNIYYRARKARFDHRSLATALEAFYVDHGRYPGHQIRPDGSPTFQTILTAENGGTILTTPINYMSSLPSDYFGPEDSEYYPARLYAYRCDPEGSWILGSRGPDNDWDIDYINAYDISKGKDAFPGDPDFLVPWTYDPSNGLRSSGDIWRVRQ